MFFLSMNNWFVCFSDGKWDLCFFCFSMVSGLCGFFVSQWIVGFVGFFSVSRWLAGFVFFFLFLDG